MFNTLNPTHTKSCSSNGTSKSSKAKSEKKGLLNWLRKSDKVIPSLEEPEK
jgi:hypothetical protein